MDYRIKWRQDSEEIIDLILTEAKTYLTKVDTLPVRHPNANELTKSISNDFPKLGKGASNALLELIELSRNSAITTSGPRCFHFVIGGSTPASMGADWLATLYDQIAYAWVSSPISAKLELISLGWLAEMFGIPQSWKSVMSTGATMSNFIGLSAGRQWIGEQIGVDIAEEGLSGVPPIQIFSSGYIHASTLKAMAMLGIGRSKNKKFIADGTGRIDLENLENSLKELRGKPVIIVATAGEPNAGGFDPISKMADLAEKYNCWLHIDGAFGLFASLSDKTSHLLKGLERAHSITVDGHKWLNVPYDCGFSFVKDGSLLVKAFRYTAEYLPGPDDPEPVMGAIGPESSRRARSFSVWATLQAYGLEGYKKLIAHHLYLAKYLQDKVDNEAKLERLAEVLVNIVCFRFHPMGFPEDKLNQLNKALGEKIILDGRVYVGTTNYDGKVSLRPAISNWRTETRDVDLLIDVILELGEQIASKMTQAK